MRPLGFTGGALIAAAIIFGAGRASANYYYADGLPNGDGMAEDQCFWCHVGGKTGGTRTDFGELFFPAGNADIVYDKWPTIYSQDSDGDGASNGLELGDPCGVWQKGGAPAHANITNPAVGTETTTEPMPDCSAPGAGPVGSVGAGPATPPPPFTSGICAVQGPLGGGASLPAWAGLATAVALALGLSRGRRRRDR